MEIELTEEQLEKVEILKSKDVDVGQAIDLLFELQHEAIAQIEDKQQDANVIENMDDDGFDAKIRAELLKRNYDLVLTPFPIVMLARALQR